MSIIRLKTVFLDDDQLDGAIHTTNIKTNDLINIESEKMQKCVRCNVTVAPAITTSCIVNVNNLNGELTSYEDYEQAMTEITNEIGIKEYWTTRVDMKFDSYDEEHYVKYAKLYRLLISMIAVTYNVKNCYRSVDLFTEQQLSVAIKNSEFEIENYDKNRESGGKNPAKSRLELRSKRMKGRSIRQEFLVMWRNRWKNAIKNFDLVGERYNDKLVEIYYRDLEAFPKKFADVTDFLLQYQNCIFTKEQMIDLLEQIGVKNPKIKYQNHKQRYGIELFNKEDVRVAIDKINEATEKYFYKSKMIKSENDDGLNVRGQSEKNDDLKVA